MSGEMEGAPSVATATPQRALFRWECRCQETPVLLATYDARGRINIKVRDRYWHVQGVVQTVCPRCGSEHTLDLRSRESEVGSRESRVESRRSTVESQESVGRRT
jgi:hypothetical protein